MRKTWIAAAAYVCVLASLEVYRWHIWSFGSDTGTFTQAILASASGFRNGPEGGSHFFFHFSPILAVLYPLVALTHSPLSLQIAQVVLVSLTAPALYALFRPYVDDRVAVRLAILALLYPPLAAIAFGEFHELAFFPALAIGLVWAADRCRWWLFATFGAMCLLTREDVCLELAVLGIGLSIFAFLRGRALQGGLLQRGQNSQQEQNSQDGQTPQRGQTPQSGQTSRRGLLLGEPYRPVATGIAFALLAVAGVSVAVAYYHEVIAAYGRWPHNHFYDYSFANGPLAVLASLLTQPAVSLPALMQIGRLTYVLEALIPVVLLPLRTPWFFTIVPGFVIVLLAREQSVWRMGNHYAALWAPWLLIATGAALARIEHNAVPSGATQLDAVSSAATQLNTESSDATRLRRGSSGATKWADAALAASAVFLVAFNPMHAGHYLTPPYGDLSSARAAIACVPRDAAVSTHDEWFSEIAADYPQATIQATDGPAFLVYADDFPNERFAGSILPQLKADVTAGRYRVICRFGKVKTYRRSDIPASR